MTTIGSEWFVPVERVCPSLGYEGGGTYLNRQGWTILTRSYERTLP